MEKEYEIKGIEKIIEKVGKEQLAKYYEVEENADFKSIITEELRQIGVPNGLEIATYGYGYRSEVYKDDYNNRICQYCKDTGKALEEIYFCTNNDINYLGELFFYIDEPINEKELKKMRSIQSIGGAFVCGYRMRKRIL